MGRFRKELVLPQITTEKGCVLTWGQVEAKETGDVLDITIDIN
jgi:hypothetical protein